MRLYEGKNIIKGQNDGFEGRPEQGFIRLTEPIRVNPFALSLVSFRYGQHPHYVTADSDAKCSLTSQPSPGFHPLALLHPISHPPISVFFSIMRPQLFRAAARSLRVPKVTPRTFATTAPRAAEVELTIGTSTPGLVHPG